MNTPILDVLPYNSEDTVQEVLIAASYENKLASFLQDRGLVVSEPQNGVCYWEDENELDGKRFANFFLRVNAPYKTVANLAKQWLGI